MVQLRDPTHRIALFLNAKCGNTTMKLWFFENMDFFRRILSPEMREQLGPAFYAALLRHPKRIWRIWLRGQRLDQDLRYLSTSYVRHMPDALRQRPLSDF